MCIILRVISIKGKDKLPVTIKFLDRRTKNRFNSFLRFIKNVETVGDNFFGPSDRTVN